MLKRENRTILRKVLKQDLKRIIALQSVLVDSGSCYSISL